MSKVTKLSIEEPTDNIMIIENGYIHDSTISINLDIDKKDLFLPQMYVSWENKKNSHVKFITENTDNITVKDEILYIFDTWGTSSYYHLLIDHIIPLWITKKFVEENFLNNNTIINSSKYLRISNYGWSNELTGCNDIFKHFFNDNFNQNISGKYKYIVYGYFFNYRPYNGETLIKYYPKYETFFNKFIEKYSINSEVEFDDKYIIIPDRQTRVYHEMYNIFNNLSEKYKVKMIDLGKYSISEQIKIMSHAYAIVGCEGAAFSNQIFMKKGSLLISLCHEKEIHRNKFHSSLAQYMNHYFNSIAYSDDSKCIKNIIKIVNKILDKYISSQNNM